MYAVYVVLITHRLDLVVGHVVHHADLLSWRNVLSQFHIERSHLAVYSRADVELCLTLAHHLQVTSHVVEVVGHLCRLCLTIFCVLRYALAYESVLLQRQLIVFLCFEIILARYELLLIERLHVGSLTSLALHLHVLLQLVVAVGQRLLLHAYLRVAQHVLLLCQLTLGVKDLQVEA